VHPFLGLCCLYPYFTPYFPNGLLPCLLPYGLDFQFFLWLSEFSGQYLPAGALNSMLSNGIIPGVGGIVVFAPQIGILLYLLYLLEDSGYMARVVF
jgi:ferrous iron transport protein B